VKLGRQAQEVEDNERWGLIHKVFPIKEYNPDYACFKGWAIENVAEATCPANDWQAHKDGVYPLTAEQRAKARKDTSRWEICIALLVLILLLTGISFYLQHCSTPQLHWLTYLGN